jgi:hypothetical protein
MPKQTLTKIRDSIFYKKITPEAGWLSVKRHAATAATWVRIQPLNTQFKEAWSAHPTNLNQN